MAWIIPFEDLSFGTDMNQNYRARRVDFDEGFSQRASRLNGTPQQWRLVWERIRDDVAEELRLFFEARGGSELIVWKPYNQANVLGFTASNWSARPSGFLVQDCSIVLSQEFDFFEAPPVNTVAPTILGRVQEGFVLTANMGTWTGDTSGGTVIEWLRDGVEVAEGAIYELAAADVGGNFRIRVTRSNIEGTPGVALSGRAGPILAAPARPPWVPEDAIGFIDLANHRAWSAVDGEQLLSAVMTNYSPADINASGLLVDETHSLALKLTPGTAFFDFVASLDFSMIIDCTVGAFKETVYQQVFDAGLVEAPQLMIENWYADFVYIGARPFGPGFYVPVQPFVPTGTHARFGMVVAGPGGAVTGSVNGGVPVLNGHAAPAAGAIGPDALVLIGSGDIWAVQEGFTINGRLHFLEFYP